MKYYFNTLVTEDDRYGIKKYLGKDQWAFKLSKHFDTTSASVWGNIINKGRETSGIYGEVIALIKHFGYKEAKKRFTVHPESKNRFLRHVKFPE